MPAKSWIRAYTPVTLPLTMTATYGPGWPFSWSPLATFTASNSLWPIAYRWEYRSWSTTPNWKSYRTTNGFLPTRGYYGRKAFIDGNYGRGLKFGWSDMGTKLTTHENHAIVSPNFSSFVPPGKLTTTLEIDQFIQPAKSSCLNKARDLKTSIPQLLGEGRQTVKLLGDTVKRLADAYKALKDGNFWKVARLLAFGQDKRQVRTLNDLAREAARAGSSDWLAWQFGWLPLVSDLVGLAELAAQHLELGGRRPRIRVNGMVTRDLGGYASSTTGPNFGLSSIGMTSTENILYTKRQVTGRAWLLLELKDPYSGLASQVGAGSIYDLASLAWELTPFSWLFDYFIRVGQWLQDLGSLAGWTVLDGGYSLTHEFRSEHTVSNVRRTTGPYLKSQVGILPAIVIRIRDYNRFTWDGLGNVIAMKGFDMLNARRLTNIAAVGYQLSVGIPPRQTFPVRRNP